MKKIIITSILSTLILSNVVLSNKVYQENYKNNIMVKINEASNIMYNYKLVKQNLQKDKQKLVWICDKLGFDTNTKLPDGSEIWKAMEQALSNDGVLDEFLSLYEYSEETIQSLTLEQKRTELTNCINNSIESVNELTRINALVDEQGIEVFGNKWDTTATIDEKIESIILQLESNKNDAQTLLEQSNSKIDEANQEIQRLEGVISSYEADMTYLEEQLDYVNSGHKDILPKE